ncbi:MAG TPA: urea ABC transporter ATP-binding subunit UrtE [Methylomirabilota bacterium]|jgi:urea transport system ATP-binding protein|nr:urea ABC transporter ATP-binding subunit UrtE [Methylomirabilota bacterium]
MLEIQGLDVAYGESQVLWDVSLQVPDAGVVCLMGRNGVGKTTLLKSIMGLLPTRAGRITFDGAELGGLRPEERAARGIGYVPQGREIFPNLSVAENLRVGLLGRPSSVDSARGAPGDYEGVFGLFPRLKQLLSRKGGVLSGGEQQQLAIARVLLARPKLLLMDEPTEGIQPNVILQIEDAIGRIKERGIAVLLVEQYLEFAWRLANSYAIMRKGAIVSRGSTAELRHDVVRQHLTV